MKAHVLLYIINVVKSVNLIPGEIRPPPERQVTLHDNYVIELRYRNFTFNIIGPDGCRPAVNSAIDHFFKRRVAVFNNIQPDKLDIRGPMDYLRIFYENCDETRVDFAINTWYDVPAISARSHAGIVSSMDTLAQMQFRKGMRLFINQTLVYDDNVNFYFQHS